MMAPNHRPAMHRPGLAQGDVNVSKPAAPPALRPDRRLTAIDEELIHGIARGWSNKRIAQARRRSAATVRNQMHALFRKLGVAY